MPPFLRDTGQGWVTAEYGMLPARRRRGRCARQRRGRPSGRTFEIQRLVGRSLRGVTNLTALGPRTIWIDCDVIQADGGTRTAAITGAYIALADALHYLRQTARSRSLPLEGLRGGDERGRRGWPGGPGPVLCGGFHRGRGHECHHDGRREVSSRSREPPRDAVRPVS